MIKKNIFYKKLLDIRDDSFEYRVYGDEGIKIETDIEYIKKSLDLLWILYKKNYNTIEEIENKIKESNGLPLLCSIWTCILTEHKKSMIKKAISL